jgi:hypothetical protein
MATAFMRTRIQLMQKHFPQGLTPDMIRLMDDVEQLLVKAYETGRQEALSCVPLEWSNQSCFGYCIMAAERIGLDPEETGRITRALHRVFDDKTLEAAAEHYRRSPY